MRKVGKIIEALMMGLLGGALATQLARKVPIASAESFRPGSTSADMRFIDQTGRMYASIENSQLAFYNSKGNALLKIGLDAAGSPFVSLHSNQDAENPKAIFKLTGKNESATLIFQDNHHNKRLIMGLDPNDPGEDPYLAYSDRDGWKHLFGKAQ